MPGLQTSGSRCFKRRGREGWRENFKFKWPRKSLSPPRFHLSCQVLFFCARQTYVDWVIFREFKCGMQFHANGCKREICIRIFRDRKIEECFPSLLLQFQMVTNACEEFHQQQRRVRVNYIQIDSEKVSEQPTLFFRGILFCSLDFSWWNFRSRSPFREKRPGPFISPLSLSLFFHTNLLTPNVCARWLEKNNRFGFSFIFSAKYISTP